MCIAPQREVAKANRCEIVSSVMEALANPDVSCGIDCNQHRHATVGTDCKSRESGQSDFIVKPIDLDTATVKRLFRAN